VVVSFFSIGLVWVERPRRGCALAMASVLGCLRKTPVFKSIRDSARPWLAGYVRVRVLCSMVAKGAAFGPPRLEDHVGDHGEHMTVSKGG